LTKLGIEVVMAVDVDMTGKKDPVHRAYATENNLVLVTHDRPFAGLTSKLTNHTGLICWLGKTDNFGGQIQALSKFANEHTVEQVEGQVFWLNPDPN